jgi:hypothetical protein
VPARSVMNSRRVSNTRPHYILPHLAREVPVTEI